MPEPVLRQLGIVGLGLIGGSVALRARAVWPDATLVGYDQPSELAEAKRRGVVDLCASQIADLASADLIVLAVPVAAIVDLMPALASIGRSALVTDVGSTKRQVMAAAAATGLTRFVGGHPMSGGERGGIEYARADLFLRRPWLLVSASNDPGDHGRRVERFVREMGSVPQWIDAATHDRVVAYVSHVPQLLAVALMNAAAEAIGDDGLSASGRAFKEMTRLASSPADLWQGILAANADNIADALERVMTGLPAAGDLGDSRWVARAFARAADSRTRLLNEDADQE